MERVIDQKVNQIPRWKLLQLQTWTRSSEEEP